MDFATLTQPRPSFPLSVDGAVLPCRSRNIAKVLSCYDGDTCRLEREILHGRDRVRLANADTPEIEGRCQEEIDRAVMARDYTRALVAGRVVTLSAIQPDKYRKRIDAYVSIDGRDLGDACAALQRRPSSRLV